MPAPVTFAAALVRAVRAQGERPAAPGPGAPSWAAVADRARLVALGLRASGVEAGHRVGVGSGLAPHEVFARELAVLSLGAVVAPAAERPLPPSCGPGPHPGGGLALDVELGADVDDLRARGAAADAAAPDAYEVALAAIDPDAPALVVGRGTVSQAEAHWALRCVDRWIGPAFGSGRVGAVLGPGPVAAADPSAALLARWWPASVGGALAPSGPDAVPVSPSGVGPALAVLTPETWDELAAALRARAARSLGGATLLRRGRVLAAGESTARPDRMGLALARRWAGTRIRAGAGLDDLVVGISLGALPPVAARDLAAAGVPVVPAWLAAGALAPITAGSVARPEPGARVGRPLPGRTVESAGATTTVHGGDLPGGRLDLARRTSVDGRGRVRFSEAAPTVRVATERW